MVCVHHQRRDNPAHQEDAQGSDRDADAAQRGAVRHTGHPSAAVWTLPDAAVVAVAAVPAGHVYADHRIQGGSAFHAGGLLAAFPRQERRGARRKHREQRRAVQGAGLRPHGRLQGARLFRFRTEREVPRGLRVSRHSGAGHPLHAGARRGDKLPVLLSAFET